MKIAVASDHGGLELKEKIEEHLIKKGYHIVDCGTFSKDSCDYPDFAFKAAHMVASLEASLGILVCTTGEGIMIAANKVKGIRCALGYSDEVTVLCRQHNNANMISFGQGFMNEEDVLRRVDLFIESPFEGGRHARRVSMIDNYHNED